MNDRCSYCWRLLAFVGLVVITGCQPDRATQLAEQLRDEVLEVRKDAAAEIIATPCGGSQIVGALASNLDSDDSELQRLAAKALGCVGDRSDKGMDAALVGLKKLLDHQEPAVQSTAAITTLHLDPEDSLSRERVLEAISRGEPRLMLAVGELRPRANWAVPALQRVADQSNERMRLVAHRVIAEINETNTATP